MISEIYKDVFKITGESNLYFLKKENLLIDTGYPTDELMIKQDLLKIIPLEEIKTVIFTHMHYDHVGNYHLFTKASFYASKDSILSLKEDKYNAILLKPLADNFDIEVKEISSLGLPDYLEVIETPGHSKGSICIYDKKRKILFSGDTLFFRDNIGRMDLPFSSPKEMSSSLNKLKDLDIEILCPGHDY
jgi:glyoxylase-like metal-dependent hydrolase (beta-lactamase superfamily II)